ncbi:MAG: radical SAM protein [Faecalibacterium sp.]
MNTTFDSMTHKAQRAAADKIIALALSHVKRDREKAFLQMVDMAEQFLGDSIEAETYEQVRDAVRDPDNKWMRYISRVLDETDPHVAHTTALNLGFEAFFRGTKMIRKNRELYQCNIPWLILFDPTSACNMHCAGCWAGEYGSRSNLSFEDMDKIVTQGKELGVYLYMLTGGEPLVRKADVLRLAEKHNDVQFAIYTNSTLIDDALCQEAVRLGNLAFMLSIEGTPETNDARRGKGHYAAVMRAMDLLRQYGLLFGTSVCYTRGNIEAVTSDDFMRMIAEKGARFGFYFHYMPVGSNAVPELLPTPEQRKYMIRRIRYLRSQECPIEFFPMDFQNDGQYVGGCIAGGRNYFHINSAGDAEPCVFIHYSNANIHEQSVLEILHSPLFMAYRQGQPFNENHLRPCPMLENPEKLRGIVQRTGARSTDLESPETVEHLCGKCEQYAARWQPEADLVWSHLAAGGTIDEEDIVPAPEQELLHV